MVGMRQERQVSAHPAALRGIVSSKVVHVENVESMTVASTYDCAGKRRVDSCTLCILKLGDDASNSITRPSRGTTELPAILPFLRCQKYSLSTRTGRFNYIIPTLGDRHRLPMGSCWRFELASRLGSETASPPPSLC